MRRSRPPGSTKPATQWGAVHVEFSPEVAAKMKIACDALNWARTDVIRWCMKMSLDDLITRLDYARKILDEPRR